MRCSFIKQDLLIDVLVWVASGCFFSRVGRDMHTRTHTKDCYTNMQDFEKWSYYLLKSPKDARRLDSALGLLFLYIYLVK